MRLTLLEYLVCPDCQIALVLSEAEVLDCQATVKDGDIIQAGRLHCAGCGATYPIVRGIPRFVTTEQPLTGDNVYTANAFGWQWQKFNKLHDLPLYQTQFLDWVYPIVSDFFVGKVVLDAGCGMGRFSLVCHSFGSKTVLAVDASDSVEAAFQNTRDISNIHVIQADLHRLPLRQEPQAQLDFIFTIGVLHHLDNPQAGFEALAQHLRPGGSTFAWVYGRENNGWVVYMVNPIRTLLTSRLPRRTLYLLSWLITVGLHLLLKGIYRPINSTGKLGWLCRILPYNDYLTWLSQFGFRHNHHVVFDHLVAPVAFYLRREEFEAWFHQAGLALIDLSWRNKNSWRGHGCFVGARPEQASLINTVVSPAPPELSP